MSPRVDKLNVIDERRFGERDAAEAVLDELHDDPAQRAADVVPAVVVGYLEHAAVCGEDLSAQ